MEIDAKEAVSLIIGQKILESLDTNTRDKILKDSIIKALQDYSCKNAIEKVVAIKASEVAAELIQSQEYYLKIKQACERGMAVFIAKLEKAMELGLAEFLMGQNNDRGYGGHAGWIERFMDKIKD